MNTEQIQTIGETAAENVKNLIGEMSDEIQDSAAAAFEQAQAEDKEAVKITLSHTIELDLARNQQKDTLSVSVRHKESVINRIPDPNQSELEFES